MIDALKNFFSKLFPKKLATETTAELPTPTVVTEEIPSGDLQPEALPRAQKAQGGHRSKASLCQI